MVSQVIKCTRVKGLYCTASHSCSFYFYLGDCVPDSPMRYEFDESESVIQFPIGFCPTNRNGFINTNILNESIACDNPCKGQWGLVFKEWESITATYPESARRLNLVTKQVDIDIYEDLGGKMEVKDIDGVIDIKIPRMEEKNKALVTFDESKAKTGNCVLMCMGICPF